MTRKYVHQFSSQVIEFILDDHGKILKCQLARVKFDLHNKYFIAWSSLIKSIPVNSKREIEAIDEYIGPKTVHNFEFYFVTPCLMQN